MELDLTTELDKQLSWHWEYQLWPRWQGLTDDEYLWEPVAGAWSVRPAGDAASPAPMGSGSARIDWARPVPDPAPVTTIAWRVGHILVGIYGDRNARYFGGPPTSYPDYDYPLTADDALDRLDQGYRTWIAGVRGLTAADLAQNCREPGFESDSMMALILHINRELIHHGAEISLLRDLYARQ